VLLGRLALYGPGAARLHEEIIPITAVWTEADRDRRPLTALGSRGEETTLDQLERALRDARLPPAAAIARIRLLAQKDARDLEPELRRRADDRRAQVARDLERRGEVEARDLARLIEAQRASIVQAQRNFDPKQPFLPGIDDAGRRQRERDHRHWRIRLVEIEREIELGLPPQLQTRADSAEMGELLSPEEKPGPALPDPWAFAERILHWPAMRVAGVPGGAPLPEDLVRVLPEHDTVLEPHWAVAGLDGGWQLLVRVEAPGIQPDARGTLGGWEATPHQRFERLLRETQIPIGVLITDNELRLVYAPRGETSGWLPFPLRPLATVAGRPLLAGLRLMLDGFRLFNDAENRRLPAMLKASREAQTAVSTMLADQVVGALHELLRGLTAAEPKLIGALAAERPQHLYEGLLTVLMRLVFVLYAEDRDLILSRTDEKARTLYSQGYSVRGLHGKLLEDHARHPDTMEERRGAWGGLVALFRLIHAGDRTGWIRARGGKLFDPDAFPFLEGRTSTEERPRILPVTDGCALRILDGLLTLKGERLSYRTLDVEQIGSVYETVMGFTVLPASGPVLAIRAGKHNRTPVWWISPNSPRSSPRSGFGV
jgi:hypothetical protein